MVLVFSRGREEAGRKLSLGTGGPRLLDIGGMKRAKGLKEELPQLPAFQTAHCSPGDPQKGLNALGSSPFVSDEGPAHTGPGEH